MLNKPIKLALWIGLVLIVGAGIYYFSSPAAPATATYATTKVTRGDLVATVSATGTINPVNTVAVGSQVSGTIQQLYADFNSKVKKGDLIVRIEPSLFQAEVAQAKAGLQSATAARDKAEVAAKNAKRQLDRLTRLRKSSMVSEEELDTAQSNYEAAEVEIRVKEADMAQRKAALETASLNLAHTEIYAPIDGVVISRDVDVGQTVAASLQAPTLFTIARDLSRMQIETDVDEAFIGSISDGQPVLFTVFAYPQREFHGRVSQVRLNPTLESGVVKYNCIIEVDNSDLALKPGMTATVAIEVEHRQNILKVPNAALRYVPDLPSSELARLRTKLKRDEGVLWLAGGGELKPITVHKGVVGETETEVSADNLKEGTIIAMPASAAANGNGPRRQRFGLF